jgi:hypothetical protein
MPINKVGNIKNNSMKKNLFLIVVVLSLLACKQEPGEIRGVVTYFKSEEVKPDVGSTVYLTKINYDSLQLYYDAVNLMNYALEYKGFGLNYGGDYCMEGSFSYQYSGAKTSYKIYGQPKRKIIEIKNKIEDYKVYTSQWKEFENIAKNWKNSENAKLIYKNYKKIIDIYSKFNNNENIYTSFIKRYDVIANNMSNNKEARNASVDASGNYIFQEVIPDEYTIIIFSKNSSEKKIKKIKIESKQIINVSVNF